MIFSDMFRACQSTETTLAKVVNGLLLYSVNSHLGFSYSISEQILTPHIIVYSQSNWKINFASLAWHGPSLSVLNQYFLMWNMEYPRALILTPLLLSLYISTLSKLYAMIKCTWVHFHMHWWYSAVSSCPPWSNDQIWGQLASDKTVARHQ